MSCQCLREAIVEVARGREVRAGTAAAIDSHVEHCPSCAARLARERQLTQGLRALASATSADVPTDAPFEAMHRRLLQAFAERHAGVTKGSGRGRWWLQVAAAVILGAGGFVWWRAPGAWMSDAPAGSAVAIERPPVTQKPGSQVEAVDRTKVAGPVARPPRRDARRSAGPSGVIRPEGFVMLATALGLPDFESGEIVRMELPVASLPSYGIDIEPDTKTTPIEADVLVGQDGQARAIRLVTAWSSR